MKKNKKIIIDKANDKKQPIQREIKEIEIMENNYPRESVNQEKIKEYAENIEKLPPITINQNNILIDGFHRVNAHILRKKTEIEVKIEQCDDDKILERSIELNAKHGLQLSYKDKKRLALRLYDGSNSKRLVNILSVSTDCLNKWVRDIRQEKEKQFKYDIIKEYLKAERTQQEVAEKFGTSNRKVSETKDEFYEKINLLNHKKDESSAEDRFGFEDIVYFSPFTSDVWDKTNKGFIAQRNFGFSNEDFGIDITTPIDLSVVPPEIFKNLLYYYTEPFDVVFFPFAKNETPEEVCKKWFRRYYINNLKEGEWSGLEDTKKWDFKNGLPKDLPSPRLVFVDIIDENTVELKELLKSLRTKMTDGHLAILHPKDFDIKVLVDIGFNLKERVICTYSKDIYSNTQIAQAEGEKKMINVYQILSIFTIN